ncbi:hypothetical protein K1719_018486 [Acacia pycnantha]|nr:hypothetical protein K1719_018486 [Acacia pycnantha]
MEEGRMKFFVAALSPANAGPCHLERGARKLMKVKRDCKIWRVYALKSYKGIGAAVYQSSLTSSSESKESDGENVVKKVRSETNGRVFVTWI